ncbi:Uronate isomerase/glucuronate isomerase [Paracholeplasma brassicae]|uniref:Uronate isomerase n=1 Tax=Acholeplasma brassicae TaxID=61635 RepID=U4KNL0_9MOLU|nr:glucuronate isomerase [Paracholeplasma brassicae]CCV65861.1 Uronate isomerase/glucuronate isomerase [Paracholeplasma brassicae]
MKPFLDKDFMLNSETAKKLYHEHAAKMPIIDYHCHLNPKEIYENKPFENLAKVWLGGDHYKWRLMRANGVDEAYITGDKPDYEKFLKWAEVVPYLVGSPLYHWTHLELQRFFSIQTLLNKDTAKSIYEEANKQLIHLTPKKFIEMSNVKIVCTTDDPTDDLHYHQLLKNENNSFKVLPAFRPDKAINIELSWFNEWVNKLSSVVGYRIDDLDSLEKALEERMDYFTENGCSLSDHGLDSIVYVESSKEQIEKIFKKARNNEPLSENEIKQYKGHVLVFLGKAYHKRQWVQQYHIGALRNNNSRMLKLLGPDTGYDAINDDPIAKPLSQILNKLEENDQLPKTIIYALNSRDHDIVVTLMQAFQDGKVSGKLQCGSAWWFNDHIDGMKKQMIALANNGLLSQFVGMLTDSRSFLSYPRHEYFRRLVCDLIGTWVEEGLFPNDEVLLGEVVRNISYENANKYFKM